MKFALITEGASDHWIIRHIVEKYFKGTNLFFRQIQPQMVNAKQSSGGGWPEVLKYCKRDDDLREIFNTNDFMIIQIDTDQSQTKPFSISHTKPDNTSKSIDELHYDVLEKLRGLINPEILKEFADKILFAICIHSIECWLLPVFYIDNHKTKTQNCLETLNVAFRKKDIHIITPKNKNEPIGKRAYESALKNWKRKHDILNSAKHNIGFKRFIDSLANLEAG